MWLRDLRAVTFDDWYTLRRLCGTRDLAEALEDALTDRGIDSGGSFREAWAREEGRRQEAQWEDLREERLEDRLQRILPERVGGLEEIVSEAMESLSEAIEWFPDVLATLDWLREQGYRTALVSNTPVPLAASWRSRMEPWFDAFVLSRDVGRVKPHEAIFREAVQRLGVLPSVTLHVGDQLVADVFGPNAMGMRTALLVRGGRAASSPHPEKWLSRTHRLRPEDVKPDLRFRSLEELPVAIDAFA